MDKENFDSQKDESLEDQFFSFLGKYVAFFQWIDEQLDAILFLSYGEKGRPIIEKKLVKMTVQTKIDLVKKIITRQEPSFELNKFFPNHFKKLIQKLHKERERRNKILHSQYLLRFVEQGVLMRSYCSIKKGKVYAEHESLNPEKMDIIIKELADLAFDVSQLHTQIRFLPPKYNPNPG